MHMRAFAFLLSVIVLVAGIFISYSYYQSQSILVAGDIAYAVHAYDELLRILIYGAGAFVVSLALLVYLGLTIRTTARSFAYSFTRDIAFSRDRLRRLYELSPVPYLLIDRHARVKRPNKAALRLLDTSEDALVGQDMFAFFRLPDHPEKLERYREEVKRLVPIEQKELQVHTAVGTIRWVLFSAENLDESRAKDPQVLVTLVDIHEQKELERIKTEFLSLASHQLRAPLANLKWYIDFLLKRRSESLTSEIVEYLNKMYRRNEEMIDLVNTLLNLSRIEMGRVQVQKEQTNITEIAHSVIEELETAAHEKTITLHTQVPETCPLMTDGRLVRVILQNLLTNAIRYTNTGGQVTLTIVCEHNAVRIDVVDTGVGIPPEEQGRIFSKMYRASNAKAMEINGNGIGLYMCKSLSEALGGTIAFDSVLGKGTTFTIHLPA